MFNAQHVPTLLKDNPRWLLWTLDGEGRKVPRAAMQPKQNRNANKATTWTDFANATDVAVKNSMGIGFALGSVQNGPTFAGVDLDKCRNPATGVIEDWAWQIIHYVDSYTEISPSGTGVKIFVLGSLPDGAKQGKVYKIEIYDRERYFTVTGQHVPGTPLTVEERTAQLRDLHTKTWSGDLVTLTRVFGFYISDTAQWVNIHCPWEANHSGGNQARDGGLHKTDGTVDGFNCFHAGCSEKTLADVLQLFGLKGGQRSDFLTDHHGNILAKNQDNIRHAITLLGVTLEHDVFADKLYLNAADGRRVLDDPATDRLYLLLEQTYHFSPPKDYFVMVMEDHARTTPVHPVLQYLDSLTWDRTPRVDRWLTTYGGAPDSEYGRQVGAKTLIAAVRRVRHPGCKHDEMLVLNSAVQGVLKSSALAALCSADWFSDDLPLNVDAKQIIERTLGKWIIEASDLAGMRKSDVEHLKAMLSRGVDGPVRMAYGHFPKERPRSFILIGTTNSQKYLKDSTGNRRFWPVAISTFDIDALRRDRDQLWAEAAAREANGESNRLDAVHWEAAARAQAASQIQDTWLEDTLAPFLRLKEDPDRPAFLPQWRDRVLVSEVWAKLGLHDPSRRGEREVVRLESVMQVLGYEKKRARGLGEPEEGDDKKTHWRWCRVAETGEE